MNQQYYIVAPGACALRAVDVYLFTLRVYHIKFLFVRDKVTLNCVSLNFS